MVPATLLVAVHFRSSVTPLGSSYAESGRFFRGANRAVVPKPTDEANRCILGHLPQKRSRKHYIWGSETVAHYR